MPFWKSLIRFLLKKSNVSIEELYRNFPADFTRQQDWKIWEKAYEGKVVNKKGRFDAVTVHPHESKLFFIVTLAGGEGSLENKPRQVALLVEDARQVELGEKEGTFLLDGRKWICLKETYVFKGRVSKFSLFDKELGSTDFKELIIVKTKIKDIQLPAAGPPE